jgi:hypothetical protein
MKIGSQPLSLTNLQYRILFGPTPQGPAGPSMLSVISTSCADAEVAPIAV